MARSYQVDPGCAFNILFWLMVILLLVAPEAAKALVVVLVGLVVVWLSSVPIAKWKESRRPCVHGFRGGLRRGCEACQAEQMRIQRQREAELGRWKQKEIIKKQASKLRDEEIERLSKAWLSSTESYEALTPREFENAVSEIFRKLGYKVKQTPFSRDVGKDAIAVKDGKKYVIECKKYAPNNRIGRREIQILLAAMQDEKGDGGLYVTTGSFTKDAIEYARKRRIELYDRIRLPVLVHQAYPVRMDFSQAKVMCAECGSTSILPIDDKPTKGFCTNGHPITNEIVKTDMKIFSTAEFPYCECGAPMRIVRGYRRNFWGCSRFPGCRETKPFDR
ncbi:restriction endonuclease [Acidobacteriia bacterium AH_259_A11_L15]|nr:restriction endonuclease [Acidobacteriia bacterium AH_259_A11_L15]